MYYFEMLVTSRPYKFVLGHTTAFAILGSAICLLFTIGGVLNYYIVSTHLTDWINLSYWFKMLGYFVLAFVLGFCSIIPTVYFENLRKQLSFEGQVNWKRDGF